MAETTKQSRKKKEPERINLDEWGNAGALDGLLSFLNITPEQAPVNQGGAKVLDLLDQRRHLNQTLPVSDTPSLTDTLPISGVVSETDTPVPDIGTPSPTDAVPVLQVSSWVHPKQATGFGNKKLYRCTSAQDGHSHTEEALYQILWQSGTPESSDTRLTTMGYGEMSKRVRLSFNNTKYACQRLIAKLALEQIAREISDIRQGKTYRVFSCDAILRRRKARGMEWVIRNKGVEFVTPSPNPASVSTPVPLLDRAST